MSGCLQDSGVRARPQIGTDVDELSTILNDFREALQDQLKELTTAFRTELRKELEPFRSAGLGPTNPSSQCVADQRPLRNSDFDGVLSARSDLRMQDGGKDIGSKASFSVALACAAFKTQVDRRRPRFPGVHCNTTRNPELAAEFDELRGEVARAKLETTPEQNENQVADRKPSTSNRRSADKQGTQTTYTTQSVMLGHLNALPRSPAVIPQAPEEASKNRRVIGSFLAKPYFQYTMVVLVLLHSICMGIAAEIMARNVMEKMPVAFIVIEVIFFLIFAAETSVNIYVHGWDWFRSVSSQGRRNSGQLWNSIECALLASQLLDIILQFVAVTQPSRISVLRTLRLARILRIIRVFKIVRAVRDLRLIVYSMTRSFKVFFWSLIALGLSTFLFAMVFTEVLLHYKIRNIERDVQELDKYFGSLTTSMVSLLQAVTNGVDWGELLEQVGTLDHPFAAMALVTYICFTTFAVMNIITGVFLHTAMGRAKDEREIMLVRNARRVFASVDHKHDGMITWSDFEQALDSAEMLEFFAEIDLEATEARNLFDLLDTTGDSVISAEEFLYGCLRLSGVAKAFDLLVLSREVSHLFTLLSSNCEQILENQNLLLNQFSKSGCPSGRKGLHGEMGDTAPARVNAHGLPELPGTCSSSTVN